MQQLMSQLQDPQHIPSIELGVTEYMLIGDGSLFEDHVFGIRLRVDDAIRSTVYRSYADLTEFHARIQKKFPKTELPRLPLDHPSVRRARKKTNIFSDLVNLPSVSLPVVEPLRNLGGPPAPESPFDTNEDIGSKKGPLQDYFLALMSIPDIAASDEFCMILDEESPDGETLPAETVSEFDILLAGEEVQEKNVLRNFDLPLQADAGEFLVWKFSTKGRDIGFSLDFGDVNVLAYSRQDAHEKPVKGVFEAPYKGICTLKWDNSHSSFLGRTLLYQARVVKSWEVENAQRTAREKANERRALELQRIALKRALTQHVSAVSGVTQSSQSSLDAQGTSLAHEHEMEGLIHMLKEEKAMLQRSLQLAEERAFQAKLAWEKELLQDPRLLMFKADLESMAAERMHYCQALRTAKQEAAGLRWTIDELRAHNAVLKQNAHDMKEALAAAQLDVASAMERVHELQEQNATLKAEKKVLKNALRTVTAQKKAVEEAHAITSTAKTLSEIATSKGVEVPERLPEQDPAVFQPQFGSNGSLAPLEPTPSAATPNASTTLNAAEFDMWYAKEFGENSPTPTAKPQDGALNKFKEKFMGFVDRVTLPVIKGTKELLPSSRSDDSISSSALSDGDSSKIPVLTPTPASGTPPPVIRDELLPLPDEDYRRIIEQVLQHQQGTFRKKLEDWLEDLLIKRQLNRLPWEFYIRSVPPEARAEFMQDVVPRLPQQGNLRVDVEWNVDTKHEDESYEEVHDATTVDLLDGGTQQQQQQQQPKQQLDVIKVRLFRVTSW